MSETLVRALTPIYLASIGCAIALTAIFAKPSTEVVYAAFNLSSVAIGAAGGSAMPRANDSVRTNNVENIDIKNQ